MPADNAERVSKTATIFVTSFVWESIGGMGEIAVDFTSFTELDGFSTLVLAPKTFSLNPTAGFSWLKPIGVAGISLE